MKRPTKRLVTLAGIGVAVVCAIGTGGWMRASSTRVGHACELGNQRTYRLAYVAADAVSPTSAFGAQRHDARSDSQVDTQIGANLIITTAACDAAGSSEVWNITQPSIRLGGTRSDDLYRTMLARDLAHPYVVRVAPDGAVRSVGRDAAAGNLGLTLVRRIAGTMQVVAPPVPSLFAQTWRVAEPCPCGDRTSDYALEPWVADPLGTPSLGFHRTAGTVVQTPGATRFDAASTFRESSIDSGDYGLDGYLESLESSDADQTQTQSNVVARNRIIIRVKRTSQTAVAAASVPALARYAELVLAQAQPLYVAADPKGVRQRALVSMLGNNTSQSLANALRPLRGLDASHVPGSLVSAFAALFALHPETIAQFESRLDTGRADPAAFVAVMQGLARAQTQASQVALCRALLRHASDEAGDEIATTLGFLRDPSLQTVRSLEDVVGDNGAAAQSAELALGSIAYTVADTNPSLAQRIALRAAARYSATASEADKRIELLAMGNAGNPADLAVVMGAIHQPDRDVRTAATLALRRQSSSDADDALRTLLRDRDTGVRLSAASAFAQREPGPASYLALTSVAQRDASPTVRSRALEALVNARDEHPDALDHVRDAAAHDSDAGVRRNAQSALDALPPDDAQTTAGTD